MQGRTESDAMSLRSNYCTIKLKMYDIVAAIKSTHYINTIEITISTCIAFPNLHSHVSTGSTNHAIPMIWKSLQCYIITFRQRDPADVTLNGWRYGRCTGRTQIFRPA